MAAYKGTPSEILENQELMELLSPMIRNDFQLAENYKFHEDGELLACPILALASNGDDGFSVQGIENWQNFTSGAFHSQWYDGDHFYLNQQTDKVVVSICQTIDALLAHTK